MKNKGFTMIELLAIITILATILLISFPTLINMTRRDKERQYNDMVNTLCKAGETYIYDNQDEYTELGTTGNIMYVDIDDLKNDDLIDKSTINPKTNNGVYGLIKYTVENDNSLKCYYTENMPISNMMMELPNERRVNTAIESTTFLNTSIKSSYISKFEIHNYGTSVPDGYESKDCSQIQDGSVMCYWKVDFIDNEKEYYEMHVSANGNIYAPHNSDFLFYNLGLYEIKEINFTNINTKYVNSMNSMLQGLGRDKMTSLNLGDKFDTSNVTSMSYMFSGTGYNSMTSLNLGDKFDTSNVTNMQYMFYMTGYTQMTSLDLGDKFDTSKVTNMSKMFNRTGYTQMTSLDLGDKFDTSNVTNMQYMFNRTGYKQMTSLDLGDKFDTSNVTNMQYMFQSTGYTSMTSLNLGKKFNTGNVTNMQKMFQSTGYTSMTSLNLGNKFDTSNVTSMSYMFSGTGYNAMTSLNLGDKFDTSKVTNMEHMFESTGNYSMISLDLGDKFDTSKVTSMGSMFEHTGYVSMTSLDLGEKFVIPTNISTNKIFYMCGKNGILTQVKVSNQTLKDKLLNLISPDDVPDFWKENDGEIIKVQP